jgi:hypothetical protein
MVLGLVLMFIGGWAGFVDKPELGLSLLLIGFGSAIVGVVMLPDPPMSRADNARATIAAATAAVASGTAESDLAALEREASVAATAAAKGAGR